MEPKSIVFAFDEGTIEISPDALRVMREIRAVQPLGGPFFLPSSIECKDDVFLEIAESPCVLKGSFMGGVVFVQGLTPLGERILNSIDQSRERGEMI